MHLQVSSFHTNSQYLTHFQICHSFSETKKFTFPSTRKLRAVQTNERNSLQCGSVVSYSVPALPLTMICSLSVEFRPRKTFPCTWQYRKQQIADHGKACVFLQGVVAIFWSLVKDLRNVAGLYAPTVRAGSCVQLVKKFLIFYGTRRMINNSSSLIAVMSQISPISLKPALILTFHIRLDVSKVFSTKSFCSNVFFTLTCCMPCPFHHPSFVRSNDTWCGIQIMNLLVILLSPVSLIGINMTTSHPDMQKIRIIGFFFENKLHWQSEVRQLLFTICTCVWTFRPRLIWSSISHNTVLYLTR